MRVRVYGRPRIVCASGVFVLCGGGILRGARVLRCAFFVRIHPAQYSPITIAKLEDLVGFLRPIQRSFCFVAIPRTVGNI